MAVTIDALFRSVDDIRASYVAIHNDMRKPTLRRAILIPGVYKPIDFASHTGPLVRLFEELQQREQEIPPPGTFHRGDAEILSLLGRYVEALSLSICLLHRIAFNMASKASGGTNGYSSKDHERALDHYDNSVYDHLDIAEEIDAVAGRELIGRTPSPWTVCR